MSITAFPVLVRILDDQRLLRSVVGTLAVACAAFGDAAGWLMLAAITAVARSGSFAEAGVPLLELAVYGVVMMTLVRPLLCAHRTPARRSVRRGARRFRSHSRS